MARVSPICLLIWLPLVACGGVPVDEIEEQDGREPPYCETVVSWPAHWLAFEVEVIDLVNGRRGQGADCGPEGSFQPAGVLASNVQLRCAARNHSRDMAERDFFDHDNPDGVDPFVRIDRTGYLFSVAAENIAAGYPTAASVVQGWMDSPGHCANIMIAEITETGVGYYFDYSEEDPHGHHYWTQTFGKPWP